MTYRSFTLLSVALLAGLHATAQTSAPLEADIPFDFHVAGKTMPAGSYVVREITRNAITIQNATTFESVALIADGKGAKHDVTGTVRFNRYGNRHFLSSIDRPEGRGYLVPQSQVELELAKMPGKDSAGQTLVATKR